MKIYLVDYSGISNVTQYLVKANSSEEAKQKVKNLTGYYKNDYIAKELTDIDILELNDFTLESEK